MTFSNLKFKKSDKICIIFFYFKKNGASHLLSAVISPLAAENRRFNIVCPLVSARIRLGSSLLDRFLRKLSKLWKLYRFTNSSQNFIPRTELPHLSSGGDHKHIPITFGITTKISPETELLAGNPTLNANFPE